MGQIVEYIKIALMNIRHNKGRSILTMLGIIIGIASVIMIISVGNGLHNSVSGELNSIAGGQIYVSISDQESGKEFTQADIEAVKENVEHVAGAWQPSISLVGTVTSRKSDLRCYADGGSPDMDLGMSDPIIEGRYYTDLDVERVTPVCIMHESDAKKLFGSTHVIGMQVELNALGVSCPLRIIGIRQDSSSQLISQLEGTDMIELELPYSVVGQYFGFDTETFNGMYIYAEPEYVSDVAAKSVLFLSNRLGLRGKGAIRMQSFADVESQMNGIMNTITTFIALVAAISLLVGGIGVMNIMLVSVTERTREIGIRKSLGARTGSILTQFLAEAAIITSLGGIIGIIIGFLGANIICRVIGFEASISPMVVLVTVLFSSAVGIFFGIYPARKAARLSPIEALRHE